MDTRIMDSRKMDTLDNAPQLADFISQHRSLNLYAIINGCRFDNFEQFLYQTEPDPYYCSLFESSDFQAVENTIPYLVKLNAQSPLLQSLLQEYNNWGYLLLSRVDLTTVAEHYKTLFYASTDEHDRVYFFYYQPRIAFAYIINTVQPDRFMGPAQYLIIPDYEINLYPDKPLPQFALFTAENSASVITESKVHISSQQLEAFEQVSEKHFIQKMLPSLSLLSDAFKNLAIEHQLGFIKHGIKQCRFYGISSFSHMENYLELMLTYGMHFDETQSHWAGKILQDQSLKGNEKIEQLLLCDNAIAQKELL